MVAVDFRRYSRNSRMKDAVTRVGGRERMRHVPDPPFMVTSSEKRVKAVLYCGSFFSDPISACTIDSCNVGRHGCDSRIAVPCSTSSHAVVIKIVLLTTQDNTREHRTFRGAGAWGCGEGKSEMVVGPLFVCTDPTVVACNG